MIRLSTVIKLIIFLAMMIAIYGILPELNRRRIVSPFTGQFIFLASWIGYFVLRKMLNKRRSQANADETPEEIKNNIDILTQQILAHPSESWKLYHQRGILKISLDDWRGVVEDLTKSLEQSREWEPTARNYRGVALAELHRHEDAIEDLSFAIEHLIANFRPQYQRQDREDLGDCLLRRAECNIALDRHEYAKNDLRLAWPFLNEEGLALRSMHLANCHRGLEDTDAAIAEARKAVAIYEKCNASPQLLESTYDFLGRHLHEATRYAEAVAAFSRAIDLNRAHAGFAEDLNCLLLWRVDASLHSGQHDVGLQDVEEMLKLNPDDAGLRQWRAILDSEAGHFKAAAATWLELLQDSPNDESLLINCTAVLAGAHDEEVRDGRKSLELANRLIELKNDPDWKSQGCLAAAYAELGDFKNAIAAAERSLELAPDDEKPRRLRRLEDFRQGKPFRCESINQSHEREQQKQTCHRMEQEGAEAAENRSDGL